jgi:hypothetical protein
LKYANLDEKNIYHAIISANLSAGEEVQLLDVLRALMYPKYIHFSKSFAHGFTPESPIYEINLQNLTLFLAKHLFVFLTLETMEINSGENTTEVFMEKKDFETKTETWGHLACKQD